LYICATFTQLNGMLSVDVPVPLKVWESTPVMAHAGYTCCPACASICFNNWLFYKLCNAFPVWCRV